MADLKTCYPVDLAGVRSVGLDEWLNWSRPMPSGEEYIRIFDVILDAYTKARPSREQCESLHWACAINYKIIPGLAQSYFKFRQMKEAERDGFTHLAFDPPKPISESLERHIKQCYLGKSTFDVSQKERLKEYWRIIRTNYGHHFFNALFPFFSKATYFMIGDRSQKEVKAFCEEVGESPVCLRPILFIKEKFLTISSDEKKEIEKFQDLFFAQIEKGEPGIAEFVTEQYRSDFKENFIETVKAFNSIRKSLSKWKLGELLVTHVGNPYHRAFASAWQSLGGQVTGFTHGNIYTYAYLPAGFVTGLNSTLTAFMVSSKGEKKLLDDAKKHFKKGMCTDYQVKHFKRSLNRPILDSFAADPPVEKVKRVMVIGYPMDYCYSCCIPENHTMAFVSLELRLVKALKKAGYQVTYKAHPDTLKEITGFFDNIADEIETKPFESVYLESDCFVYPHHFSTTFGFSLMTNRPIVLLSNPQSNHWHSDVLPLLRKRCRVVETSVNELRQIHFSEDDLVKAVGESVDLMDYSIIEEFAL